MDNFVNERKIFRSALLAFVGLAYVVILVALWHCIAGKNMLATGLISFVGVFIAVLAIYLLRSNK